MRKLVVGILAHVDAGKTTLSESLLYLTGKIRKFGRVDKKDTYLDNYELERSRGITIFSKQAVFEIDDTRITLLDTPGHVDFSTEMERTLQVLDYAILVISGADGIQGHTKTLWRLLSIYKIPVFLFINKMDQAGTNKDKIMDELKKQLDDGCIDFGQGETEEYYEQLAMCDEPLMEAYLEKGNIQLQMIRTAINSRKVFPCFFGSALKLEGVEEFIQGIVKYTEIPFYPSDFGARVFKIIRDEQGNRLTYMKITGGKLKTKDVLSDGVWEEKVNQIRIYSGEKFEAVNEVEAGTVCAVTGLSQTKPGQGLGIEKTSNMLVLEPVLSYQIILPEDCDPRAMLPNLRLLEEEDPELNIVWDEQLNEIKVQIMGQVQIEVLQSLIKSRFGIDVSFDSGKILYKETIGNTVEGVGHFEPLRHYAEVHLLMEPGERGSGLQFDTQCSEDMLSTNWQRLILSHLEEKVHKGVLTGSAITDMKITLVSGKAHNKHTQGGDFREATYRAVRQGLMEAESILLEPYYAFQLQVPEKMVGRAMTDIDRIHGKCQISKIADGMAVVTGTAPVATMRNYHQEMMAYTKGEGRLFCYLKGYEPCHNTEEVIKAVGYDAERDVDNPADSVFCANGTSFIVSWDEVKDYMHVESYFEKKTGLFEETAERQTFHQQEEWIAPEEVDKILNRAYYANQGKKSAWQKQSSAIPKYYKPSNYTKIPKEGKDEYLLVDGYNIIFAWPELKELADVNMDGAKVKLLDSLSNYQSIRKCRIIVVFDAYRVHGHIEEVIDYGNIHVVYTREAQTADQYIEKFARDNQKKYNITVATSDGLQQIIIRGAGCSLLSARELKDEIEKTNEKLIQEYKEKQVADFNYLKDTLPSTTKEQIDELLKEEKDN
ncbi:MAG: GTP-binding protein [Clostridiales bacterium]|nr:GTP-binding protein [Clostridiales bacterium]